MKHLQYLGTDRDLAGGWVTQEVMGESRGGMNLHQLTALMEMSTASFQ